MFFVICPPDNWKHPIRVTEREIHILKQVAERLDLTCNHDTKQRKLYLGLPNSQPTLKEQVGKALSGKKLTVNQEQVVEDIIKATQHLPAEHTAYILATAYHESLLGKFMQEVDSGLAYEGRKDLGNIRAGDGPRFKGRGYVQLTGRRNYQVFGRLLFLDLESHPDLASKPEVALKILVEGMSKGLFTGVSLSDYDTENGLDFVKARRVINGTDRAEDIAQNAKNVLEVLNNAEST